MRHTLRRHRALDDWRACRPVKTIGRRRSSIPSTTARPTPRRRARPDGSAGRRRRHHHPTTGRASRPVEAWRGCLGLIAGARAVRQARAGPFVGQGSGAAHRGAQDASWWWPSHGVAARRAVEADRPASAGESSVGRRACRARFEAIFRSARICSLGHPIRNLVSRAARGSWSDSARSGGMSKCAIYIEPFGLNVCALPRA